VKRSPEDRFWKKVGKTKTCWLWLAGTNPHGYGMFRVEPYVSMYLSHRYSYELAHGKIPDGLNVLHSCDNPPCVNPDHLFLGDQFDNMADMYAKNRRINKTSNEDISQIVASPEPYKIGKELGVTSQMVLYIITGKFKTYKGPEFPIHITKEQNVLSSEQVKAMFLDNRQYKEIAEDFNTAIGVVGAIKTRQYRQKDTQTLPDQPPRKNKISIDDIFRIQEDKEKTLKEFADELGVSVGTIFKIKHKMTKAAQTHELPPTLSENLEILRDLPKQL